ncbi:MAG: apolipoprotein N-acyltransferase [Kiritimatiellaceae bacterium]|nr:apolipoprotein N-acyltransferase [Kiritimatiellaceae bacterium]
MSWRTAGTSTAVLLSGVLLAFSFEPMGFSFCGWVALVPLMWCCAGGASRRAARLGWLTGVVFFLASLYWLRHVSVLGVIGLALYCALYFIPFAVFVSLRRDGWRSTQGGLNVLWMTGAAIVWAASEYLRAIVATGFPWNFLGVSQYQELAVIQMAEWGGVYLISALIVFVNAAVTITLLQYRHGMRRTYRVHLELMVAIVLVALAWSFGMKRLLTTEPAHSAPVRIAMIQPNIPEVGNWERVDPEVIYDRLEKWTEKAQDIPDLDLIIWPETAIPDFIRYNRRGAEWLRAVLSGGPPILSGCMDLVTRKDGTEAYYNASMLFDSFGDLLRTYYKQHLVIFGEYIPFDGKIAWIDALTPVDSSFTPGRAATLFTIPEDDRPFSVLICFEDSLPYLARRAALKGATWLVNQTNDSWFDPDCGSAQHLANSVFRCIETRLPMVRCANTGISCSIDTRGRVTQTLAPRTEGYQIVEPVPVDPARTATLYVRFGDVFAQACLTGSVALFILLWIKKRNATHA